MKKQTLKPFYLYLTFFLALQATLVSGAHETRKINKLRAERTVIRAELKREKDKDIRGIHKRQLKAIGADLKKLKKKRRKKRAQKRAATRAEARGTSRGAGAGARAGADHGKLKKTRKKKRGESQRVRRLKRRGKIRHSDCGAVSGVAAGGLHGLGEQLRAIAGFGGGAGVRGDGV